MNSRNRCQDGGRELVVLAFGGLGDCLLLSPFIRFFHRSREFARIVCVCPDQAVELFDRNPYVDEVVGTRSVQQALLWSVERPGRQVFSPYCGMTVREAEGGGVDFVAEPRLNPGRGTGSALRQIAAYAGLAVDDWAMDLFTSPDDRAAARDIFERVSPARPVVLVGFQSALAEKDLPRLSKVATRKLLRQRGFALAEVDGRCLRIGRVVLTLPGLRAMAEFAKLCAAVLTVDSFLGHLAAAVGRPAVVLFGPSNPAVYGHAGNRNLRAGSCSPCAATPRRKACKRSACMHAFSPADIVAQVCEAAVSGGPVSGA